ncbi:hypothetical protein BDR26DRAFT_913906 [Obelidium mucronatum]|nr:hypothetical protein BDR26DRAFT_913906 [Obelidium mucronatum]
MSAIHSRPSPKQIIASLNLKSLKREQAEVLEIYESYRTTPTPDECEADIYESYASFDESDYYSENDQNHSFDSSSRPHIPAQNISSSQQVFKRMGHRLKQNLTLPVSMTTASDRSRSKGVTGSAFQRAKSTLGVFGQEQDPSRSQSDSAVAFSPRRSEDTSAFGFGRTRGINQKIDQSAHPMHTIPARKSSNKESSSPLGPLSLGSGAALSGKSATKLTVNHGYKSQVAAHR